MLIMSWSNWNSHSLLVGKKSGEVTMEDSAVVSNKDNLSLNT